MILRKTRLIFVRLFIGYDNLKTRDVTINEVIMNKYMMNALAKHLDGLSK